MDEIDGVDGSIIVVEDLVAEDLSRVNIEDKSKKRR